MDGWTRIGERVLCGAAAGNSEADWSELEFTTRLTERPGGAAKNDH